MSAKKQSLATLRKAVKRAAKDDPADEAGVETALLLAPIQLVVGAAFGSAGWLSLLVMAAVVPVGMLLANAMVLGGVEGLTGMKFGRFGWPAAVVATSFVWHWVLGSWTAAGVMVAVALALYATLYVRTKAKRRASISSALPQAVVEQLVAVPKDLPKDVRGALDRAVRCHAELHALLGEELASDAAGPTAVVDGDAMRGDATACLVETARQAALLGRLSRAEAGADAQVAIRRRIVAMADGLSEALAAAVGYAAARGEHASDELAARAEQLHLTAQGLAEAERALGRSSAPPSP